MEIVYHINFIHIDNGDINDSIYRYHLYIIENHKINHLQQIVHV